MNNRSTFDAKTPARLIVVGLLATVGIAVISIWGSDWLMPPRVQANSFSQSAIGHGVLVETLRRTGLRVLVNRHPSFPISKERDVLVVAEPRSGFFNDGVASKLRQAPNVLFALPKWQGTRDGDHPEWVGAVEKINVEEVGAILRRLDAGASVKRLIVEHAWDTNRFADAPRLDDPQTMVSGQMTPIIASGERILIGELRQGSNRIWVLSDPDLISNHGMSKFENAHLAVSLVRALGFSDGNVIIDETLHGFALKPNFWRAMLAMPFLIPTLMFGASVILLAWLAALRFGPSKPAPPTLAPGKVGLIDNAAHVLRYGDWGSEILTRYVKETLVDVSRRFQAPKRLDEKETVEWLDRLAERRGIKKRVLPLWEDINDLSATAKSGDRRLVRVARALSDWKGEMVDDLGRRQ